MKKARQRILKTLKNVMKFYRNATNVSLYSQTSLIRTPKEQDQVSALQKCLYYKGISGTKQTVPKRGVHKERLDCI